MKLAFGFMSAICVMAFLAWATTRLVAGIEFDIACGDFISQAASSPNPAIAADKLAVALSYADHEGLTQGNTGILFSYPTNDVGFWHQRLVDSQSILLQLPANDSPLEISNTLMRVRETLVSGNKDGQSIEVPAGISIFPHNVLFAWWCLLSLVFAFIFGVAATAVDD